jgi:DNA-binding MarR family transcriptional regulator
MVQEDLSPHVISELFSLAPMFEHHQAEALARRHLTQPRVRLLFALEKASPLIMTELSVVLDITPRAVTALVDGLETLALITRTAHPSDRRATVVELTETGRQTCVDMRASYLRFAADLLGDCSHRDLAATLRVLGEVRTGLEKERAERKAYSA